MKQGISLWVVFAVAVLLLCPSPLRPARAVGEPVLVVTSAADAGPGTLLLWLIFTFRLRRQRASTP